MFVHGSLWPHYLSNMISLFTFALVFASTNDSIPAMERRSRQTVFIFGMLLSGALANVVSMRFYTLSYGASGLVYAAWGITSVFCLFNALLGNRQSQDVMPYHSGSPDLRRARRNRLANFAVFVVLIGAVFLSPALFLSAGPGVNVLVHGLSFLFAFMGTAVWYVAYNLKNPGRPRASAEGNH
jgi:membrane associated rhomboid family serine protease